MRTIWTGILLLACLALGAQPQEALKRLLQAEELKHATVGVSVKRVNNGAVVCEYLPGAALPPASLVKLFSTLYALEQVGPEHTYRTTVGYSGKIVDGILEGNLIIEAGGDPTLESQYFPQCHFTEEILQAIKKAGIHTIRGRVEILELSADPEIPGSWLWEDVGNYYGAVYHDFNFNDNLYTLTFQAGKAGATARLSHVSPEIPGVRFRNQVISDPTGKNDVWIYGGPAATELQVCGSVCGKPASYKIKGAMHHPAEVCRSVLTQRLLQEGVRVLNDKLSGEMNSVIRTIVSPPVKEIVFYTNKRSVNLFSEALGALGGQDAFEQKVRAMLESAQLDPSGLVLKDACGLSPFNAVPASLLTDLLLWAHQHADPAFYASLPEGGVDGGLYIYSAHPSLGYRLRAKTGSFTGVRSLAGYLTRPSGEIFAFTIMINHFNCTSQRVQELVRDFLIALQ